MRYSIDMFLMCFSYVFHILSHQKASLKPDISTAVRVHALSKRPTNLRLQPLKIGRFIKVIVMTVTNR